MIIPLALCLSTQLPVVRTVIPYFNQDENFRMSLEVPYTFGKWKLRDYQNPDPAFWEKPLPITYTRSDVRYEKNGDSHIDLFLNEHGPGSETYKTDLFMDTNPDFEFKSKWNLRGWKLRVAFFVSHDRKRSIGWFLAQGKYIDVVGYSFFSGDNDKTAAEELTDTFKSIASTILPSVNVKPDNWKKHPPRRDLIP